MPSIHLGVIGLGLIWLRAHKPTLATLQEALCDMTAERRAPAASDFPTAHILTDVRALLQLQESAAGQKSRGL